MNVRLDSILLFALVIPVIMTFNLSPFGTPYWLFGLVFLGLLTNIIIDISKPKTYFRLKEILLWGIIFVVLGSVFSAAIIERHITHPIYRIHDMPLQQEIALRFFIDGKNPYSTSYFGTFLEQWNYSETETNPALYHFVLLPFYLLFTIPFYFVSNAAIGYFDARIPLFFLFASTLFLVWLVVKDRAKRLLFLILLAFNPATLPYLIEGRSDFFMFGFLFAGFFLLHRGRDFLAGIPIGLAFAVKQSVWPIMPFYLAYLYLKKRSISKTLKLLIPFILILFITILPFLVWNSKAFLDSTIFYLSGNIEGSYPIAGYGLGKLLSEVGIIKDLNANYPFWIWQLLLGFPVLILLVDWLKKDNSVFRLIVSYGIFLFVFWYLSRYFNNSHLGFLSLIFITAYFWPKEAKK